MPTEQKRKASSSKFQIKIGTKIIALIAVLLILVVASVNWVTAKSFQANTQSLITDINVEGASNISNKLKNNISIALEKDRNLAKTLVEGDDNAITMQSRVFFENNANTLAVFVLDDPSTEESSLSSRQVISPQLQNFEGEKRLLKDMLAKSKISLASVFKGETQVATYPIASNKQGLIIAQPFIRSQNTYSHVMLVLKNTKLLTEVFQEVAGISGYLINRNGDLLAKSPELEWPLSSDLTDREIVSQALASKVGDGQLRFKDPSSGEIRLGVFRALGFGGLTVVTEILEARAFEASNEARIRTALIGLIILCITLMLGLYFADSISYPIGQLADAAEKIGSGEFKTRVHLKGRDEVAELASAFNEMAAGLEERERVKDVFNKFHSKEIAQQLLKGEIKLGGVRKQVAILFSDLRNFTTMSEAMQPEEVVEMLNEYLTAMVTAIRKHGGIIDKFVGDAVIAVWGIPDSAESDVENSVKAALEMRKALGDLNVKRQKRGKDSLKIGIGIHYGPAVAGNVGSEEKMEYTVLGDSVNLASRIESLTKQMDTDILVSSTVVEKLEHAFPVEFCGNVNVKGKAEAVKVFKIVTSRYATNADKEAA
jgi:adenylate cyclase